MFFFFFVGICYLNNAIHKAFIHTTTKSKQLNITKLKLQQQLFAGPLAWSPGYGSWILGLSPMFLSIAMQRTVEVWPFNMCLQEPLSVSQT